MTHQHARLVANAIVTYGFRLPTEGDDQGAYLRALIQHVAQHDYAAAHELRVGKPQAEWTPADVTSFEASMRRRQPKTEFAADETPPVIQGLAISGFAVTEASLLDLARTGLETMMQRRRDHPHDNLPIFVSVLLEHGEWLTTPATSDDRIAVIKHLARSLPVFGFFVVFDAFIHQITVNQSAGKVDAILGQLGTRDRRLLLRRPYHLVGGVAVFDDPPPADVDVRADPFRADDPYAEIFVSTPPVRRPQ